MHWLPVEAIWLAFSQGSYLNFKWNNISFRFLQMCKGTEVIYMYRKLFTEAPGYLAIIKIQSSLINFSFSRGTFLLLHWEWEETSRADCQVPGGPFSYYSIMPDCSLLLHLSLPVACFKSYALIFPCTLTVYFQNLGFYFLNFQSLVFQLPGTEHLFHFNASNIIKETDDREYKNDEKCCKSEISTTVSAMAWVWIIPILKVGPRPSFLEDII